MLRVFSFLLAIILLGAGWLAIPAHAQDEIILSSLEVDLWPEYDKPAVLVIYRVVLPASISLPAEMTFRIPAAAGDPGAVAVRQPTSTGESGLFTIPYTRQVSGEWGLIKLNATMPELQIEYYDPGLSRNGNTRQYAYNWPGDYAVNNLSILIQEPVGALGMQISPASGSGITGTDGLVYYEKQVGSLPAGQTFSLSISYQKNTEDLTVSGLTVQPNAPVEAAQPAITLQSSWPWIVGVLGVGLIVGGGLWYWQSGKSQASSRQPRRRHKRGTQSEIDQAGSSNVYCHQCGNRASPSDRFCRLCGTKLRIG